MSGGIYASLEAINDIFRKAVTCETEEALAKTCLAVAEKLTTSKFGFIGEINEEGSFDTIAISDPGWSACVIERTNVSKLITDMEIKGLWSLGIQNNRSYIINDTSSHPGRSGMPEGHPEIKRLLVIPLRNMKDQIIGTIALANKDSDYTLDDQKAIENLSIAIVQSLYRKRIEIENKEIKNRLQRLFNNIQAGILIIDGKTRVIADANPAAMRIIGRNVDDIIGKKCRECLCADSCEGCPLVEDYDGAKEVENKEVIVHRIDGSSIYALLTITSILIKGRRFFINTLIDITKQRDAEIQLQEHWKLAEKMLFDNITSLKNGAS
jgi:PAS domain S-box-containing protein